MPPSACKKKKRLSPFSSIEVTFLRSTMHFSLLSVRLVFFQHLLIFFFNDTATTEIYTLSLHDALPIFAACCSSLTAPPSPWLRLLPFSSTAPLATCSQA